MFGRLCVLGWVFFLGLSVAWAEEYTPLYNYGQKISWCTNNCSGECEPSFLCYYAPDGYEYYFTARFSGFKDIYNPLDPRVVCGYAPANLKGCVDNNTWVITYQICGLDTPGCLAYGQVPESFRVFLPPGAKSFQVIIHYPRDDKAGVAVRFKAIPEAYQNLPKNYDEIPWHSEGSVSLEELAEEVFYRNNGGTIFLDAYFSTLTEEQAGWLYFQLLPQFEKNVHEFQIQVWVDYQVFKTWYSGLKPCPAEGLYCWDYLGNPQSQGAPVCDANHLYACHDAFSCVQVGGYWYDDACHAEPQCSPTYLDACHDAFSCVQAGGHWCNEICQAEECTTSQCGPDNLTACTNENDCTAAGGHWWWNECHAQEFSPPVWQVQCVDNNGTAEFWVTVTDCGSLCGRQVKVKIAATDPNDLAIDYCWRLENGWISGNLAFNISLQEVPPTNLLDGYSISTETVSGWYAGIFIDVNGDGILGFDELQYCQFPEVDCRPGHLELCLDKASCEAAGGYWVEEACKGLPCEVPEETECQIDTEEACIEAGCGWSPGTAPRCYSCLSATTEVTCSVLEGCLWDGKKCLPQSCGGS